MTLAIAILNYNGASLLERFLPSVMAHTPNAQLVVIDNGSTDNSIEILKQFPSVRCIALEHNMGYAKGYNEGIAQIDAELICLLNSDVDVGPNWATAMVDFFKSHPLAAFAQPKIKDLNNPEYFEYAGAAGGFIDFMGLPYCRGRVGRHCDKDVGQFNDTVPVTWASGACLFVRKPVFEALGGFDASFFMHFEEIDLCLRAQAVGHQVWAVGTSEVLHLGGGSLATDNPKKLFYNIRNSLITYTKTLPLLPLLGVYVARATFDTSLVLFYMVQIKFDHVRAIMSAYDSFLDRFSTIYKARTVLRNPLRYFSVLLNF